MLALVVLLVSVLGAKFRGEVPKIFGYSIMRVISGSMEDEIPTGMYILVKECEPDSIKKGDIISFYSDDPTIYGMPNTHRVIEDAILTDKGYEFITRGDANLQKDAFTAKEDKLIGKHVANLTWLTAFSNFLGGNAMFVILVILQAATVAIVVLTALRKGDENNEDENNEKTSK